MLDVPPGSRIILLIYIQDTRISSSRISWTALCRTRWTSSLTLSAVAWSSIMCQNRVTEVRSRTYISAVPTDHLGVGRMLALAHSQLKPLPTSLLFLVLPAPCLNNSRYVTTHSLKELMRGIGFKMLREQCRLGGKLTYTLWGWGEPASDFDFIPWERKVVEVEGSKRNNFVILM